MKNIIMHKKGEDSWIRWIRKRIKNNLNFVALLTGETGIGKCQPKGSKVLMADGCWNNIEDIKVGDFVLSPQKDGTNVFSKVIKTNEWFCNETYDVKQLNKSKKKLYSCSNNHIIPLYYRYKKRGTKNGKRFTIETSQELRQYSANEIFKMSETTLGHNKIGFSSFPINNFMNRNNCEIEPYSLGVWIGDGMFRSTKNKKDLSITSNDEIVMDEISKHYDIMSVFKKKNTTAKSYYFSINSNFAKLLKNNGLDGKYSGDKFIPKNALTSDIDYRKRLLAGLIDSDGYYGKNGGYSFTQKSKRLVEDIKNLVYSLGGRTGEIKRVKKTIKSIGFTGYYYTINLYIGDMHIPILIKRKKRNVKTFYLNPNRCAIKLSKSSPCQVYGFELDSKSHWYVTDNWMVTHNSWNALNIAHKLDPDFDSVEQVAFKFSSLMRIVNKFNNGGEEDVKNLNKKKIKVCIFDEAQTDINRRDWQKKTNRFLLHLLSTFRHQNIIVLFTTPYEDYVDSAALKLFHAKFECQGWSKKTGRSRMRPKILQYNPRKKKFYEHSLFVIRKKKMIKLVNWDVGAPPKHIIDPYEKTKFAFTNALNKKIYDEMIKDEGITGNKDDIILDPLDRKKLTDKQLKVMKLMCTHKTQQKVADILKVNVSSVNTHIKLSRNKGYKIEEFKNG